MKRKIDESNENEMINAIQENRKLDFQMLIVSNGLTFEQLKLLGNNIYEWINISIYNCLSKESRNLIYRFIFTHDLAELFEYYGISSQVCFHCLFLMAKHNSIKCIAEMFPYDTNRKMYTLAMRNSNVNTIKFIWDKLNNFWQSFELRHGLVKFLQRFDQENLKWALSQNFRVPNI